MEKKKTRRSSRRNKRLSNRNVQQRRRRHSTKRLRRNMKGGLPDTIRGEVGLTPAAVKMLNQPPQQMNQAVATKRPSLINRMVQSINPFNVASKLGKRVPSMRNPHPMDDEDMQLLLRPDGATTNDTIGQRVAESHKMCGMNLNQPVNLDNLNDMQTIILCVEEHYSLSTEQLIFYFLEYLGRSRELPNFVKYFNLEGKSGKRLKPTELKNIHIFNRSFSDNKLLDVMLKNLSYIENKLYPYADIKGYLISEDDPDFQILKTEYEEVKKSAPANATKVLLNDIIQFLMVFDQNEKTFKFSKKIIYVLFKTIEVIHENTHHADIKDPEMFIHTFLYVLLYFLAVQIGIMEDAISRRKDTNETNGALILFRYIFTVLDTNFVYILLKLRTDGNIEIIKSKFGDIKNALPILLCALKHIYDNDLLSTQEVVDFIEHYLLRRETFSYKQLAYWAVNKLGCNLESALPILKILGSGFLQALSIKNINRVVGSTLNAAMSNITNLYSSSSSSAATSTTSSSAAPAAQPSTK